VGGEEGRNGGSQGVSPLVALTSEEGLQDS